MAPMANRPSMRPTGLRRTMSGIASGFRGDQRFSATSCSPKSAVTIFQIPICDAVTAPMDATPFSLVAAVRASAASRELNQRPSNGKAVGSLQDRRMELPANSVGLLLGDIGVSRSEGEGDDGRLGPHNRFAFR